MLYPAALATIGSVFAHVDLFEAEGNVVAIAYDGPRRPAAELSRRAHALQRTHRFRYALPSLLSLRRAAPTERTGQVLSDDFAPVESLRAIERHNARR
jgi:spermidine synthase